MAEDSDMSVDIRGVYMYNRLGVGGHHLEGTHCLPKTKEKAYSSPFRQKDIEYF